MTGVRYPIDLRLTLGIRPHLSEMPVKTAAEWFSLWSRVLFPALVLVASMNVRCNPTGVAATPTTGPLSSTALFSEAAAKPDDNRPADKTALRSRLAGANLGLFSGAGGPAGAKTLTLNLFSDVQHTAVLDRVDRTPTGFVWVGHVQGVPNSLVTLSVAEGTLSGSVTLPDKFYQIRPAASGAYAISDINQAAFPRD